MEENPFKLPKQQAGGWTPPAVIIALVLLGMAPGILSWTYCRAVMGNWADTITLVALLGWLLGVMLFVLLRRPKYVLPQFIPPLPESEEKSLPSDECIQPRREPN